MKGQVEKTTKKCASWANEGVIDVEEAARQLRDTVWR